MILVSKLLKRVPIRQLFFFGVSGVAGYVIDASITTVLKPSLGVYFARIPAFIAAATITWIINRNLTFGKGSSRHRSILKEYLHYLSLMVVGLIVNYTAYAVSITLLSDISHVVLICVAIGSLAGMLVNYIVSRRFIYNKPTGPSSID